MKTLAWIPCAVELIGIDRKDEHVVHVRVAITAPGGVPQIIVQPIALRDNFSSGDEELIFMAAVSHLQADFRAPAPAPSFAAKDGAKV
jgi:hypothetical protein